MEMRKRVFIIDECHQLTDAAWPVLLKLIEEPPEHVIFILCTTELGKVLETIRTRCQPHQFRPLKLEDIVTYTKNIASSEKIPIDEEALRLIATSARGSLRDALSKIDKVRHLSENPIKAEHVAGVVGVPSRKLIRSYLDSVLNASLAGGLEVSSQSIGIGVSPTEFFREVANVCHDLLLCTSPGFDLSRSGYVLEEQEALKALSQKALDAVGKDQYRGMIRQWIKSAQECSALTVYNLQPQFQVNVAFVDLFDAYRVARVKAKAQKEKGAPA
jgi:DNA polymerase III subunit gamma/tau